MISVNISTGERRLIAAYDNFMAPEEMQISSDGNFAYISDWHNDRVIKLNILDGSWETFITASDMGISQVYRLSNLALFQDTLFVSDIREPYLTAVNIYTKEYQRILDENTPGFENLKKVEEISPGVEKFILINDIAYDDTNNQILLLHPDGLSTVDLKTNTLFYLSTDLAANSSTPVDFEHFNLVDDNIFLFDYHLKNINIYDLTLKSYRSISDVSLRIDTTGNIFSNTNKSRLYFISSDKASMKSLNVSDNRIDNSIDIQTFLSANNAWLSSTQATFDSNNEILYHLIEMGENDTESTAFLAVDFINNTVSKIDLDDEGLIIGMAIDASGTYIYYLSYYPGSSPTVSFKSLNILTGERTIINDNTSLLAIFPVPISLNTEKTIGLCA